MNLKMIYDFVRERRAVAASFQKPRKSRLELALTGALLLGIAGLAQNAEGSVIVDNVTDVVIKASNNGGESRTYETYNLTYLGNVPTQKVIVFVYKNVNQPFPPTIGGLENNPSDPFSTLSTATGFINKDDTTFWGLNFGDVINGNNGWFYAGVDLNGDGDIGIYDNGVFTFDDNELFTPEKIEMTGFQAFPQSGDVTATIQSINITPEPATLAYFVASAGLGLLNRRKKYN